MHADDWLRWLGQMAAAAGVVGGKKRVSFSVLMRKEKSRFESGELIFSFRRVDLDWTRDKERSTGNRCIASLGRTCRSSFHDFLFLYGRARLNNKIEGIVARTRASRQVGVVPASACPRSELT
jgi:hypothetical protein